MQETPVVPKPRTRSRPTTGPGDFSSRASRSKSVRQFAVCRRVVAGSCIQGGRCRLGSGRRVATFAAAIVGMEKVIGDAEPSRIRLLLAKLPKGPATRRSVVSQVSGDNKAGKPRWRRFRVGQWRGRKTSKHGIEFALSVVAGPLRPPDHALAASHGGLLCLITREVSMDKPPTGLGPDAPKPDPRPRLNNVERLAAGGFCAGRMPSCGPNSDTLRT